MHFWILYRLLTDVKNARQRQKRSPSWQESLPIRTLELSMYCDIVYHSFSKMIMELICAWHYLRCGYADLSFLQIIFYIKADSTRLSPFYYSIPLRFLSGSISTYLAMSMKWWSRSWISLSALFPEPDLCSGLASALHLVLCRRRKSSMVTSRIRYGYRKLAFFLVRFDLAVLL